MGHVDNYVKANPLQTPAHHRARMVHAAVLRHPARHHPSTSGPIPAKLIGVFLMFSAIGVIFALPWLDTSKVKCDALPPGDALVFVLFVIACLGLGWCGGQEPSDMVFTLGKDAHDQPIGLGVTLLSQILALYYFAFFLIILPWIGLKEDPLPVPASISEAVLAEHAKKKG
ncbi:MAG: hypothetical protein WDN06_18930 [Asticcacaulis sp.]